MSFTAYDRCDSCGAQAYVRWANLAKEQITELLFCGHHSAKHRDALEAQGFTLVTDSTGVLHEEAALPELDPT